MASLATTTEFAAKLRTTFDADETAQAQILLDGASGVIRTATGQTISSVAGDVFTQATATTAPSQFRPRTFVGPGSQWLDLPQRPVVAVSQVKVGGQVVTDWTLVGDRLFRSAGWDGWSGFGTWWPAFPSLDPFLVEITYDHGLAGDDDRFALAKSACMAIATQGVVNPDAAKSEAIDDYRIVFRDDVDELSMSESLERRLVQAYGRSAFTIKPAVRL